MSKHIPKEKLIELHERSNNGIMNAVQCAVWLPQVCAYALELLKEKDDRERAMRMVKKIEQFKKAKKINEH